MHSERRKRPDARWRRWLLGLLLACCAFTAAAQALPERFDPARNALADYRTALELARAQGKRVIVDVGGEWCVWCKIMDRFFDAHDDLAALRDRHYVWLRVHWSKDQPNTALLARFPRVDGYPHLFVVDADGRLVHSQDTGVLEAGRSYDLAKFRAFLAAYAP
jgi:thiol:disulfide interchange protein